MRSANGFAVCSRRLAAPAAKQRTAHVTPQPKPAKPVSLPLCGRQARKGLLLWYNNRGAVIIPYYGQGDTRARPAAAPMANYTMSAKRHGIIGAVQTAKPFVAVRISEFAVGTAIQKGGMSVVSHRNL